MRVLNLYAGIGGNRKLWKDVEVTALELDPRIAMIYKDFYPDDNVIVEDAHAYLLKHFKEYEFIWSSPPCPSHSKFRLSQPKLIVYPDMKLYEEIIVLQRWCKAKWVVENVVGYYKPLIKPKLVQRHYVWCNFSIQEREFGYEKIRGNEGLKRLSKFHDIDISKYDYPDKRKLLRNCVHPPMGEHILKCAFPNEQIKLEGVLE